MGVNNRLEATVRKRPDGMVEYKIVIGTSHVVNELDDLVIPSEYIAGYVANSLREFVNSSTLDVMVYRLIENKRVEEQPYDRR